MQNAFYPNIVFRNSDINKHPTCSDIQLTVRKSI